MGKSKYYMRMGVMVAWVCFATTGFALKVDDVLPKHLRCVTAVDRNHDGKLDTWLWQDDQWTTNAEDQNADGKIDAVSVSGDLGGQHAVLCTMGDDNHDGEVDSLWRALDPDGSWEWWSQSGGTFVYKKTDKRTREYATAVAKGLGSYELTEVRVSPILKKSRIDDKTTVRVDADGKIVSSYTEDISKDTHVKIRMNTYGKTNVPGQIDIDDYKNKIFLTLWDSDHDGRFDGARWIDRSTSPSQSIQASDLNNDGKMDHFIIKRRATLCRLEQDKDFDGLLDYVMYIEGEGKERHAVEIYGDEIPDRAALRSLPAAEAGYVAALTGAGPQ